MLEGWWWIVPAAAGAGTAAYLALTTRTRRARRLELDAARREVAHAHRALIAARAQVRAAQAQVLTARAQYGQVAGAGAAFAAKRELQAAKRDEKSASLALRAGRSRVRAASALRHAAAAGDPLPIERLFAAHDAVTARWLEYETDAAKALAFPRMLDARHPATFAFLQAQREAQQLRPASARERISPQQFLDYRTAVHDLETAFGEAERQAGVAVARPTLPLTGVWPIPGWRAIRPPAAK